jgi:hypothetical protein
MPACGEFAGSLRGVLLGAAWTALNSPDPDIRPQSEAQQRHVALVHAECEAVSDWRVAVFMPEATSAL